MTSAGQSYTVALTNFEGPLDLLLALIERKELAVTEVAIAQVTGDYLATISGLESVSERELTWFLDIATRLVVYKSRALVPAQDIVNEEEAEGSMAELAAELARYKRYRDAARRLVTFWGEPLMRRARHEPLFAELPPSNLTLRLLLQNRQALQKRVAARQQPPKHRVTITRADMSRIMNAVIKRLVGQKSVAGLIPKVDRRGAVVHLLAVLELIKREVIEVSMVDGEAYVSSR
ncbi:segregation/condensation protein A [Candidatus Saccharibacteria bacterium]|nr:segregation/condensation protein A [Candidatus Saccharibacteria bacterium]